MAPIHMGTTKVEAGKTALEITAVLTRYGVSAIQTQYKDGKVIALDFILDIEGKQIPFSLPVRWEGVYALMKERNPYGDSHRQQQQAVRTAWRQVFRWVEAQLALVETNQAEMTEVFMPYMLMGTKKTLYSHIKETGFKQIGYEG